MWRENFHMFVLMIRKFSTMVFFMNSKLPCMVLPHKLSVLCSVSVDIMSVLWLVNFYMVHFVFLERAFAILPSSFVFPTPLLLLLRTDYEGDKISQVKESWVQANDTSLAKRISPRTKCQFINCLKIVRIIFPVEY